MTAAEQQAPMLPEVTRFDAAGEKVRAPSPDLARELPDLNNDLCTALRDSFGLLGFALARTWPDRPGDLDDWARRALGYAGLPQDGPPPAGLDRRDSAVATEDAR